jgi:15-cis-phytoene synthase
MHSRVITRKSASNLALAFLLLPRAKRDAMSALYAFCREVDDVTDDESTPVEKRREQLAAWRADVRRACAGETPQFTVNRELQPVIQECRLPFPLFDELLKGCEMDFDIKRYENFEQLDLYCYRVASVVGLLSIEIFGYRNPACRDYAVFLGKALQLTNILRDVKTDAGRGRIYLPLDELRKHGVSAEQILRHEYSERFAQLAGDVAVRAKDFLPAGAPHPAGRGPPGDGRRRIDGFGLLAAVAKTGTATIQCFWPGTHPPEQGPKGLVDFWGLAPSRLRRGDTPLRSAVSHLRHT